MTIELHAERINERTHQRLEERGCNRRDIILLVPETKTDGSLQLAVNNRLMNRVTEVGSYLLHKLEENIENLAGGQIFSTLDAASAYHIIPVEKRNSQYLAFVSAFGSYTI